MSYSITDNERTVHTIIDIFNNERREVANPAVVFDIDDTLIDSVSGLEILPVTACYHFMSNYATPFIITSRVDEPTNRLITINQLIKIGIVNYRGIFFRPRELVDYHQYKKDRRKYIVEKLGYSVVMSIGDSIWDVGEYGGYGVLLTKNV